MLRPSCRRRWSPVACRFWGEEKRFCTAWTRDGHRTLVRVRSVLRKFSLALIRKVLGLASDKTFPPGRAMQRRTFIMALGGSAAGWPLAARAQQPAGRVYRVGYLTIASRVQQLHLIRAFEEGLRSLGYRVGENVIIEYRFADGEMDRLPANAADVVRLGVDIIVATGGNPNTVAAMKATTTIPIVMTTSADPVSAGLVASLARPGGNVTGSTL